MKIKKSLVIKLKKTLTTKSDFYRAKKNDLLYFNNYKEPEKVFIQSPRSIIINLFNNF